MNTVTITPEVPQTDFESFAASMPETAEGLLNTPTQEPTQEPSPTNDEPVSLYDDSDTSDYAPPTRKKVNVTKKVRRAMNKMKTKLANVPIMWFHNQALNNPEWELDDEEKELIQESVDTVFDVLDIEFEITPLSWTLTSIYWVLCYPLVAIASLWLIKKERVMKSQQANEMRPEN